MEHCETCKYWVEEGDGYGRCMLISEGSRWAYVEHWDEHAWLITFGQFGCIEGEPKERLEHERPNN